MLSTLASSFLCSIPLLLCQAANAAPSRDWAAWLQWGAFTGLCAYEFIKYLVGKEKLTVEHFDKYKEGQDKAAEKLRAEFNAEIRKVEAESRAALDKVDREGHETKQELKILSGAFHRAIGGFEQAIKNLEEIGKEVKAAAIEHRKETTAMVTKIHFRVNELAERK